MKYFLLIFLFVFLTACSQTQVVREADTNIVVSTQTNTTQTVAKVDTPVSSSINTSSSVASSTNSLATINTSVVVKKQELPQGTPTRGTGKENVKLASVFVSPLNPLPGEEITVSFDVINTVLIPLSDVSYLVTIKQNDAVIQSDNGTILNITDANSFSYKKTFTLDKGTFIVHIVVDPANEILELNEKDNVKDITLVILSQEEKDAIAATVAAKKNSTTKKKINSTSSSSSSSSTSSLSTTPKKIGKCLDSDGKDFFTAGTCKDEKQPVISDFCIDGNTLWEWYCDPIEDKCVYQEESPCICKQGKCQK